MVAKQRVVDNFSGDVLNERWTLDVYGGTGNGFMVDAINGGYRLEDTSSGATKMQIKFNDKRQYSNTGAVIIGVLQSNTTSVETILALGETDYNIWNVIQYRNRAAGNMDLLVRDASTTATTASSISSDNGTFHLAKAEIFSTYARLHIDGNFEAIETASLPTTKMQPIFGSASNAAGNQSSDIRYLEAYNT